MIPNLERRTRTWIYETNFTLGHINTSNSSIYKSIVRRREVVEQKENESYIEHKRYALVVEGIKMGASIQVNGINIGNVTDQFLRYIFPLPPSTLHSELTDTNSLSITFDPEIDTHGRFMACSGGWDWAPYSMAAEASCSSRRVFSFGIFKPIYIVEVNEVAIVNVVPKVRYLGDSTVERLVDGRNFELVIDVHLQLFQDDVGAFRSGTGEVIFRASFMQDAIISVKDGLESEGFNEINSVVVVKLKTEISLEKVDLWWPNGLGDPKLYTVQVTYRDFSLGFTTSWVKRRIGESTLLFLVIISRLHCIPHICLLLIGFRSIALITHKETKEIPEEGTGSHGMYFRVNGVAIWARGANVVPMSQLEGRLNDEGHQILLESVVAANMNMLRVWGGGMIMPDSFYNSCDENGILLFHDLMFVEEQFHSLESRKEVGEEIRYIVRHLCTHPSIVLWNGCNECDHNNITSDVYSQFAMAIVASEDGTRPIWGSSPSSGWSSGVHGRDGLPNGNKLTYRIGKSGNESNIESHGPYNHGTSKNFSTVNGHWDEE